jgi:hypothetical protein
MNGSIGMGFNPFLKWKRGLALAEFTVGYILNKNRKLLG